MSVRLSEIIRVGDCEYVPYSTYKALDSKYRNALFKIEYERENRMIERDAAKELRERVEWMLECQSFRAVWPSISAGGWDELHLELKCSRKSVEELL